MRGLVGRARACPALRRRPSQNGEPGRRTLGNDRYIDVVLRDVLDERCAALPTSPLGGLHVKVAGEGRAAADRARDSLDDETGEKLPAPTALVLGGGGPLDETTSAAAAAAAAFACPVVNLYGSADGVNCHTGLDHKTPPTDRHGVVAGCPDPRVVAG